MTSSAETRQSGDRGGTNLEFVTLKLRDMILSGAFQPGERIAEIPVSAQLGVSRTPVRLALNILEQEGLLTGASRRGFAVRAFSIDEVADAIDTRGVLEGMAARLVAEKGLSDAHREELEACITGSDGIMEKGYLSYEDTAEWTQLNVSFHDIIVEASGNAALAKAIETNDRIPLASAGALAFNLHAPDLMLSAVRTSHDEHVKILQALVRGEGARVEALMREHAYRSREAKRRAFDDMKARRGFTEIPGLDLVTSD
tara:strand:+ start:13247 stop:14017 length:771 start_codon:yes stop_codon:yes gene_type:complete